MATVSNTYMSLGEYGSHTHTALWPQQYQNALLYQQAQFNQQLQVACWPQQEEKKDVGLNKKLLLLGR
jgi:hypothetical protein